MEKQEMEQIIEMLLAMQERIKANREEMLKDRKAYREDLKETKSVQTEMREEMLAKMDASQKEVEAM
jgi:hypothetical protein